MRVYHRSLKANCSMLGSSLGRTIKCGALAGALLTAMSGNGAEAQTCAAYTYSFSSGTNAVASQVNQNFDDIRNCANNNLAPLASPSFTGFLGIGAAASQPLDITRNHNGGTSAEIRNNDSGSSVYIAWTASNGTTSGSFGLWGTGLSPSGLLGRANGTFVIGEGSGGLTLGTQTNYPVYFGINNVDVARINTAGELTIGYGATDNGAYLLQVNSQIFATSAMIATSDLRTKAVIGPPSDNLLKAAFEVPTILYTRTDRPQDRMRAGYGAQNWQRALEDNGFSDAGIVVELKDGTLALDESAAAALKIAALEREIKSLRSRVAKLEATP